MREEMEKNIVTTCDEEYKHVAVQRLIKIIIERAFDLTFLYVTLFNTGVSAQVDGFGGRSQPSMNE